MAIVFGTCTIVLAAPPPKKAPKALLDQVQHLTELLRDSDAVGYPDATMVQIVPAGGGESLALAVFTIEGFGGGNGHTQFFAVFNLSLDQYGKHPHYALIDVIPIAGKNWRAVLNLQASIRAVPSRDEKVIALQVYEMGDGDPQFAPSHRTTVRLLLKNGRLSEENEKRNHGATR